MLLFSALISCNKKETQTDQTRNRTDVVELIEKGKKEFLLDSNTSYQTLMMSVYAVPKSSKRYLVYENRIGQTVQFYDFDEGNLAKEIKYEREGPNGVGKIRGFYVHTLDSVYLMSSKHYQLILVDSMGKVLNRYPLISRDTQVADWSLPAIYTSTPAILKDGILNFFGFPESKPIHKKQPVLAIQLSNFVCELRYRYPKLYQMGESWGMLGGQVSVTATPTGSFLYSFACDPYVYETTDHETDLKHFAGSRFFERTEPWEKGMGDGAEEAYVTRSCFRGIVYDSFREVYYRFTHLKLPALNARNERNTIWNKPMSVIILNNKFQVIGETRLESNRYDFRNWLVVKEGLLICNSNQHNPDLEEGKLKFTLFVLQPTGVR